MDKKIVIAAGLFLALIVVVASKNYKLNFERRKAFDDNHPNPMNIDISDDPKVNLGEPTDIPPALADTRTNSNWEPQTFDFDAKNIETGSVFVLKHDILFGKDSNVTRHITPDRHLACYFLHSVHDKNLTLKAGTALEVTEVYPDNYIFDANGKPYSTNFKNFACMLQTPGGYTLRLVCGVGDMFLTDGSYYSRSNGPCKADDLSSLFNLDNVIEGEPIILRTNAKHRRHTDLQDE